MCSSCKQVHDGARGSKCPLSTHQSNNPSEQADNVTVNPENISQAQAEATANQVMVEESASNSEASASTPQASQDPVLKELLNISKRFGHLEQQAAKDRQILSGLVTEFGKQGESVRQHLATATSQ